MSSSRRKERDQRSFCAVMSEVQEKPELGIKKSTAMSDAALTIETK